MWRDPAWRSLGVRQLPIRELWSAQTWAWSHSVWSCVTLWKLGSRNSGLLSLQRKKSAVQVGITVNPATKHQNWRMAGKDFQSRLCSLNMPSPGGQTFHNAGSLLLSVHGELYLLLQESPGIQVSALCWGHIRGTWALAGCFWELLLRSSISKCWELRAAFPNREW